MTPDERQMLSGLFDRVRSASGQTRDKDAESFISDAVRAQPYAPYLLAQTVIVQEQALRAANERLQDLEAKVHQAEASQQQGQGDPGGGGFLGSIGRSIFGSGGAQQGGSQQQGYGQQGSGQQGYGQQGGYPPQSNYPAQLQAPAAGPWGQGQQAGAPQGGSFLKGALGAAAGVAGGVLLANSISGLFHGGNNPFGIASGLPGMGGGFGGGMGGGGETVINNYYEGGPDGSGGDDPGYADNGGLDQADFGDTSGGGFDSDDGYNV